MSAKAITETIKTALKERLGSPFISAFVISWIIWNYRAVMVALSIQPLTKESEDKFHWFDKFYLDDTIYELSLWPISYLPSVPKTVQYINNELLVEFPVKSALFFIFLYPMFAIFPFLAKQFYKLSFKIAKVWIEDMKPHNIQSTIKLNKDLRTKEFEYETEINRINKQKTDKDIELTKLRGEVDNINQRELFLDEKESYLNQTEEERLNRINELNSEINKERDKNRELNNEIVRLRKKIPNYSGNLDAKALHVLYLMAKSDNGLDEADVAKETNFTKREIKISFAELKDGNYINYKPGYGTYSPTNKGFIAIKNYEPET